MLPGKMTGRSTGYQRLLSRRLTSIFISAPDFLWDLYKALARMMLGSMSSAPSVGKRPSSKAHQTEYGYVQSDQSPPGQLAVMLVMTIFFLEWFLFSLQQVYRGNIIWRRRCAYMSHNAVEIPRGSYLASTRAAGFR